MRDPGQHAGAEADAAVTAAPGAVLAVQTADCAPIALLAPEAVGVVHAGWRGVSGDVIGRAVSSLRALGATDIRAIVGPSIEAACYEFGVGELELLVGKLGEDVRATTRWGTPAFDLRAAVARRLREAGVADVEIDERCTACDPSLWSFRGAADEQRQAVVAWLET